MYTPSQSTPGLLGAAKHGDGRRRAPTAAHLYGYASVLVRSGRRWLSDRKRMQFCFTDHVGCLTDSLADISASNPDPQPPDTCATCHRIYTCMSVLGGPVCIDMCIDIQYCHQHHRCSVKKLVGWEPAARLHNGRAGPRRQVEHEIPESPEQVGTCLCRCVHDAGWWTAWHRAWTQCYMFFEKSVSEF